MDIALERKFLSTYKMIFSAERICDISSDIVVPDTKEDILRIIYTNAKYKIRSKDVEAAKLIIHGELEVNAAYVTDNGDKIDLLRTDIPFECEFENEDIDSSGTSVCDIKLVALESRILNPRKIMVSAQLLVCGKCYHIEEFSWYEKPVENKSKVYFKNASADLSLVDVVCEKTFSLEDELDLNGVSDDAQIISANVEFVSDSADAVGSKLIVKGHTQIGILYVNDGKIEKTEKAIGFSQIFELTERDVVPEYTAYVLPTGDYFEIKDSRLSFEIHAVMQIVCTASKQISFLSDAYACGAQLQLTEESKDICISRRKNQYRERIQLIYTSDFDVLSVENTSVTNGRIKTVENEISVPVYADIIYTAADNQLRSAKIQTSAKFSTSDEPDEFDELDIRIDGARSVINGKEITVIVDATVTAVVNSNEQARMITAASVEEQIDAEPMPSVYMCRASDNDLWKLAKQYKSDVKAIAELNKLDDSDSVKGRLLIIPRIK